MKFKIWLETIVYHGSSVPILHWDSKKHLSGYYPGFYAWPERQRALQHGQNVYYLNVDDPKFYVLTDPDQLKREAIKAGFPATQASGYQDVQYLKSKGYKGIKRGLEYIIFNPEEWSATPQPSNDFFTHS